MEKDPNSGLLLAALNRTVGSTGIDGRNLTDSFCVWVLHTLSLRCPTGPLSTDLAVDLYHTIFRVSASSDREILVWGPISYPAAEQPAKTSRWVWFDLFVT